MERQVASYSNNKNSFQNLVQSQIAAVSKWASCNGELWGVGPTAVFASAAAIFLYHELEATIFVPGDHSQIGALEQSLITTMVLGMLALMVHMWVCTMRFLQYYLDTLIRDSPNVILEMTTAGLLGSNAEMVPFGITPLGPLTRFLRQQQPQIHITVCWFLSLCYADYVRKNYCQRFNLPYLERWQAELHDRASRGMAKAMARVNSFVGAVDHRLRGLAPHPPADTTPRNCMSRANDEICLKLLNRDSETTADAIDKLRSYIDATRCSCNNAAGGSTQNPCHSIPPNTLEPHAIPSAPNAVVQGPPTIEPETSNMAPEPHSRESEPRPRASESRHRASESRSRASEPRPKTSEPRSHSVNVITPSTTPTLRSRNVSNTSARKKLEYKSL